MTQQVDAVRSLLATFAAAVRAGDVKTVCSLLDGRAREMQGCGDPDREGLDAQLVLALRGRQEITIEAADDTSATATFPDFRPSRPELTYLQSQRAQRLLLSNDGAGWRITDIIYQGP